MIESTLRGGQGLGDWPLLASSPVSPMIPQLQSRPSVQTPTAQLVGMLCSGLSRALPRDLHAPIPPANSYSFRK